MTAPAYKPLLPILYISELEVGSEWWHCYTLSSPDYDCGPLVTYAADYRFALVNDVPLGTVARHSYYIGASERSALFETVLRTCPIDRYGFVHLRPGQLANRGLVKLRLKQKMPVIKLYSPARHRLGIAKGSALDKELDHLTRTTNYLATNDYAGHLDAQCRNDPTAQFPLPGVMWSSRQIETDLVAVMFTPPNDKTKWDIIEETELDTAEGRAKVNAALAAGDMQLAADPRMVPPVGTVP